METLNFTQCTKKQLLHFTKKFYKDVKRLIRQKIQLKEQIKQMEIESDCGHCYKSADEKLAQAKVLLERFLGLGNLWNLDCKDYFPLRKEVEQFLKEQKND